jgi:cystathionine gamma-synthase
VSEYAAENPGRGFETLAIHAGQAADPETGAVITPIYQTSTYAQDGVGNLRSGYEYSRTANPTRTALEECLAALEGGGYARTFASGMAATDAVLRAWLRPGDHLVIPDDAYGGTFRLLDRVLSAWGVKYTPVSLSDPGALRGAIREETKLVWCETPTNPLLSVTDIAAVSELARDAGCRLVVDNTFASPYLQNPLELGADAVVHSTTKYLGGHSDVVGGAVVTNDPGLAGELHFLRNAAGAAPGPFDAWLVLRGAKTLGVRMDRHCANAARIAEMLEAHPRVREVYYPGLPGHAGHEVAAGQMRGFGGMVSFTVDGDAGAAQAVCGRTRLFTLAESLGGIESLIEHPAAMTHASAAGSALAVPGNLVRLSVGIERVEDLLADLTSALG